MKRLRIILMMMLVIVSFSMPVSANIRQNNALILLEGDVWHGEIEKPETILQKDGVNFYEITKCSQLAYVAQTGGVWRGYNYILSNNLILNESEITWDSDGNCENSASLNAWKPIYNFTGTFDGGNYTISGLYVSHNNGNCSAAGLFETAKSATFSNVKITNSYVLGNWSAGGIVAEAESTHVSNCTFSGYIATKNGNDTSSHGCGGICGYLSYGSISHCKNYGIINADYHGGGICGREFAQVQYCTNYGTVTYRNEEKSRYLGGITGRGSSLDNCLNYGQISGKEEVGGIAGWTTSGIKNCQNYGNIIGTKYIGGIVGSVHEMISNSSNKGVIRGESYVGGIVGYHSGDSSSAVVCCNLGDVYGSSIIGGIAGMTCSRIANVYNIGDITGESYTGGICGQGDTCSILLSYNIGDISGTTYVGAIIGSDGVVWNKDVISSCYFLQTETINNGLKGCGSSIEVSGMEGYSVDKLGLQDTYRDFDFSAVWAIDANTNGGYPYLLKCPIDKINISGIRLNKEMLSLGIGDQEYLLATLSPVNAERVDLFWNSSDKSIATVTPAGKVTAIAPGNASIRVSTKDGNFSAICDVTVTARSEEEYRINSITFKSMDGDILDKIPYDSFWTTVSVTNQDSHGDTMILLATYTANKKYLNAMCARVKDIPIGAAVELSFLMDNSNAQIADIKAIPISSFKNVNPTGKAMNK